jgi:hypothetical protein
MEFRTSVDWKAVRAGRPGKVSPLREYARRPPTRAEVVRAFVTDLGARYDVEVWAFYNGAAGRWEIDWEQNDAGEPSAAQVAAAVMADPALAQYRDGLRIGTEAGAARRWARSMLAPGAALILDTETTDLWGAICELGVVDAHSGEVLIDTLVNPGIPITEGARWIHAITDRDVAGAPAGPDVLPNLLAVTRGRHVLAYGADFDARVICSDSARYGLDAAHLGLPSGLGSLAGRVAAGPAPPPPQVRPSGYRWTLDA